MTKYANKFKKLIEKEKKKTKKGKNSEKKDDMTIDWLRDKLGSKFKYGSNDINDTTNKNEKSETKLDSTIAQTDENKDISYFLNQVGNTENNFNHSFKTNNHEDYNNVTAIKDENRNDLSSINEEYGKNKLDLEDLEINDTNKQEDNDSKEKYVNITDEIEKNEMD